MLDIEASPVAQPLLEAVVRPAQRRHGAADRLPAAELEVEPAAARPGRSPPLGDGGAVPTCATPSAPATSGWRGRAATAISGGTLLSVPAVPEADRSLPVPARPRDWLAERQLALADGLRRLAAKARDGAVAGASIEDRVLRVDRTEAAVPDGAADLVTDLYRRMPEARITDILLEADDATRFTEAFTHLRTGSPCRDRIGLLNVLFAEGINLGLRKMAEATTTHGFWELMRIARWHVEGDAFDRALAIVVEARAALPMAGFWGTGRTASSDGQFFPSAGRGEALNLVKRPVRGRAWRQGVLARLRPFLPVRHPDHPGHRPRGPLHPRRAPDERVPGGASANSTPTRAASPTTSSPRARSSATLSSRAIRDLPSKRLYVFDRAGVPKLLRPLVGGKVNVVINDNYFGRRIASQFLLLHGGRCLTIPATREVVISTTRQVRPATSLSARDSLRLCSPPSRRVAALRPRFAGLTALTAAPRTRPAVPGRPGPR